MDIESFGKFDGWKMSQKNFIMGVILYKEANKGTAYKSKLPATSYQKMLLFIGLRTPTQLINILVSRREVKRREVNINYY